MSRADRLYVAKCDRCGTLGDSTSLREAQADAILHRQNEDAPLDHNVDVAPVAVWQPPPLTKGRT